MARRRLGEQTHVAGRASNERFWRVTLPVEMSDAVISAGVGLAVGLVPFAYRVRKDREEARHREAAADAEAARLAKVEEQRKLPRRRARSTSNVSEERPWPGRTLKCSAA